MKIKTISFVAAVVVAAVFAGCEWTSSDGEPTWSGNYEEAGDTVAEMNFSGTYRNDARGGCAVVTKSPSVNKGQQIISSTTTSSSSSSTGSSSSSMSSTSTKTPTSSSSSTSSSTTQTIKPKSKKESFSIWQPSSSTVITLSETPNPGTVSVSVKLKNYDSYTQEVTEEQWAWVNDGTGNLVGNSSTAGKGRVNGNQVTLYGYYTKGSLNDVVTVSYITQVTEETITNNKETSKETIYSEPSKPSYNNVASITVSQNGSSIKLHTSNGITMSGNISTVNVFSNDTSVTYSAQFSASSGTNSIVGTLDDRTGQNRLDATWTSGELVYDVNGFCGTSNASASQAQD